MRPIGALKILLEAGIIPGKRIKRVIHVLLCERRVYHQLGVYARCVGGEEWLKSIITADVVRDGVGDRDIFETASGDLEIVLSVSPRP